MPLSVIGLSHNTGAPVDIRERVAFTTPGAAENALVGLRDALGPGIECVLVSTCNRTELYLASAADLPSADVLDLLLSTRGLTEAEQVRPYFSERIGHRAIEHLFRVGAGLDSMILGETDIVRQIKESYRIAADQGCCGKTLNLLFHEALRVAKRTRSETDMGRGAFSIGHAAAEVARNIFGGESGRTVLLLGAGKMTETTARHLLAPGTAFAGGSSVVVANRTYDRAVRLAETLGGQAIRYDVFPEYLAKADIVIASTAAPRPIVSREMVENALKHRRHRDPLFFIDIAVPRDIEAAVGDLPGVFLYNIDDLKQLVEEDMAERRTRAARAEQIVREEALSFARRLQATATATPILTALRANHHAIIAAEVARLRQRLPHLSPEEWKVIEASFTAVENKLLHGPTVRIKEYAASPDHAAAKFATVRELFDIGTEEEHPEVAS
ncbi:MAG: glutamyl-tRNA reductase [Capsulimonadales bacterium]|nr:glutamyl-tRNA reductase [Capsulimonadales bacterium]